MNKANCIIVLLLLYFQSFGQSKDSLSVNFKVNFNLFPLELNNQYITFNKDTVLISNFKCYISALQIHYADKSVFVQKDSYHLLDIQNPSSLQIAVTKFNNKAITKVTFNIGIDSLTSVSGALNGDLDPTKGMYWAWQSGYINMKIEGKSPSCATRKNEFHFHLGGYRQPFYTLRNVEFNINDNSNITIGIDLAKFFDTIDLSETNSVMIPGKTAMQLSDDVAKLFYLE
jgi:hypothetical protein